MSWLSSALGGIAKSPLLNFANLIPGAAPWIAGIKALSGDYVGALTTGGLDKYLPKGVNDFMSSSSGKALMTGLQSAQQEKQMFGGINSQMRDFQKFLAEKYKMVGEVDRLDQQAMQEFAAAMQGQAGRESGYAQNAYAGNPDATDTRLFSDMQIPFADAREKIAMRNSDLASTRLQRKSALMPNAQDYATGAGLWNTWANTFMPWNEQRTRDLAALSAGGGGTVDTGAAPARKPWKLDIEDNWYRARAGAMANPAGLQYNPTSNPFATWLNQQPWQTAVPVSYGS